MRLSVLVILLLLTLYVGAYVIFRSVHIETYANDHTSYVIYPAEDEVFKLFRPLAYVDERLTHTKSHIGPVSSAGTVFQEIGVLARNNFGLKPNTWYLLYQDPGGPYISIELSSVGSSFFVGDRVAVTGMQQNDRVLVSRITKQKL